MIRYIVVDDDKFADMVSKGDVAIYGLSYTELKEKHQELCDLKNSEFIHRLPEALHLACVICWLKELPNEQTIADNGIIHELIHLLHTGESDYVLLKSIRKQFKTLLELK